MKAWTYRQCDGWILWPSGERFSQAYAGHEEGVNNPSLESVQGVGPLPCGLYVMGEAIQSAELGPVAIPLTPDPANQMYGRCGFFIHGDEKEHVGEQKASHGCVVAGPFTRNTLRDSENRKLVVVSGLETRSY